MHNINYLRTKNKVVKYLFLLSGIIVLLLIFMPYLNKEDVIITKKDLEIHKPAEVSKKFNLIINNSIFEGLNKDNLPYKIIAKNVTKENNNIYNLNYINADYKILNGDLEILADTGVLNEATKIFTLSNNVHILFKGLILTSNKINFDLNSNLATSQYPVEVNFKNSTIKASSFNADDTKNIINFKGNVISIFDLDDF